MNNILKNLFNKDYVAFNNANERINFYEKDKNGVGYAYFTSNQNTIIIKVNNKNPIFWCAKHKDFERADGAFFVIDENNKCLSLHLLEMKLSLGKDEFEKATRQIRNMYILSLGIIAMLGFEKPDKIVAHIAYSENVIDKYGYSDINTSLNKIPLGSIRDPIIESWKNKVIPLYHGKVAKLIIGQRTDDGTGNFNCDFGMV